MSPVNESCSVLFNACLIFTLTLQYYLKSIITCLYQFWYYKNGYIQKYFCAHYLNDRADKEEKTLFQPRRLTG